MFIVVVVAVAVVVVSDDLFDCGLDDNNSNKASRVIEAVDGDSLMVEFCNDYI